MSMLGPVPSFHSCVAANSKNVKYAFLFYLWTLVNDMTGGGNINSWYRSKYYHSGCYFCPPFITVIE